MKLIYRITLRITLAVGVIFTIWSFCFYLAIIDEINDEVDDSLEDYSELLILRALRGEKLPEIDNGSNNQYFIKEISAEYIHNKDAISYKDTMVFIREKNETEPARILTTLFKGSHNRYYELTVSIPTIEKKDFAESILFWIIILYILLWFTIIIVNLLVLRRSFKPLYRLLNWLSAYRIGQKNNSLENETNITEFKILNEAILDNMHRNEEMYEQQRQFIGNASHELQTPIAICRNKIEIMMEDEVLSESQLKELWSIHQTLDQITKQNRSLLLLLKIDNGQFVTDKEIVLNELLERYLTDFKDVYSYKHIQITYDDAVRCAVRMNEDLAVILISNLLKNSFVHNIEHGEIRITLSRYGCVVANTGVNKPLDKEAVFERYYHGNSHEGSSGLGLAIVKTICKQQNIAIEYCFIDGLHTFQLKFSE